MKPHIKLNLKDLHGSQNSLCHPSVARMTHFARIPNLPCFKKDERLLRVKHAFSAKAHYHSSSDVQSLGQLNLNF